MDETLHTDKTSGLTFGQAFHALREGKCVRRAAWAQGRFWVMSLEGETNGLVFEPGEGDALKCWHHETDDIRTADWEIVPEA